MCEREREKEREIECVCVCVREREKKERKEGKGKTNWIVVRERAGGGIHGNMMGADPSPSFSWV